MKSLEQVRTDITRRLTNTWHTDLTGLTISWPHAFPLGAPAKADLDRDYGTFHKRIVTLQDWAKANGASLTYANRTVLGTLQPVPTHVTIPEMTRAAAIAGDGWATRLNRNTARLDVLHARVSEPEALPRLIRSIERQGYEATDFDLLVTVADWLTGNDPTGLTPRQVPIPGVHAKWLNHHQPHLLALTHRETLGLLPEHPQRIHFTYLDPDHRAAGGRVHDSATVGDSFDPAYQPQVVVISENKDTAIHFPPVAGGIAVEGAGFGGKTAAEFEWLVGAPRLYYWGDIDAHGYEILNGWRADGVPVTSILMDPATQDRYEPFGTNKDAKDRPLVGRAPKPLPLLTDNERTVYERLTDPAWPGHRRIEQERIPLGDALACVAPCVVSPTTQT